MIHVSQFLKHVIISQLILAMIDMLFFVSNETTSHLLSFHVYDCYNVSKFSIFDAFEIYKALKFYLATSLSNENVVLFDKLTMSPQEAYHLYIYLKVFLYKYQ